MNVKQSVPGISDGYWPLQSVTLNISAVRSVHKLELFLNVVFISYKRALNSNPVKEGTPRSV